MKKALVWLRRDLRLADNPALYHAARDADCVIPVYIHAPHEEGTGAAGAASQIWLHKSLTYLSEAIDNMGSSLVLKAGESTRILRDLMMETGADRVYWTRSCEPDTRARDHAVEAELKAAGVSIRTFPGSHFIDPVTALKADGTPYKVFTPYWKGCVRPTLATLAPPLPTPRLVPHGIESAPLSVLGLLPDHVWPEKFDGLWQPGEAGAQRRLMAFIDEALTEYGDGRDFPGRPVTSRLSAHLHFGEITPNQIVHQIKRAGLSGKAVEKFLSELGWRDFAHSLLLHFPHTVEEPLNPRFAAFPWATGQDAADRLGLWQRGETGFSLVDAGMKELWNTGTMHNRVRMVAASFLVKNLGVHWREGAAWFHDTLLDADLANNTLGWQWVAGCGADAAPFFRIFNPETQADKFDPDGSYRARHLGADWRNHAVSPMVDLKKSREAALAAYESIKV